MKILINLKLILKYDYFLTLKFWILFKLMKKKEFFFKKAKLNNVPNCLLFSRFFPIELKYFINPYRM